MHHDKVAPNLRPWKVEERVDLIVRQLDARISMYVDVIERIPGHPPQFRVRDTKTASRKPAQQAADISAQLQLYGLGVQKKFGPVSDVHLDCLVQTKTAAHVEHRESPLTNVRPALLRMEHAIKQIRAGAFMPAPPDHWKCSDKWCDFWANDCPFGRRSRTSFQTPEIPKD
jgi:RecB family exonuclease